MGADIHAYIEYYDADRKKWAMSRKYQPDGNRCYYLFAILAGVRSYGESFVIKDLAGIPDDASKIVLSKYNDWGSDAHSATHYYLHEFINTEYFKAKPRTYINTYDYFRSTKDQIRQESNSPNIPILYWENQQINTNNLNMCGLKYLTEDEMKLYVERHRIALELGNKVKEFENHYTIIESPSNETYGDLLKESFFDDYFDKMMKVMKQHKLTDSEVRLVMWFDN